MERSVGEAHYRGQGNVHRPSILNFVPELLKNHKANILCSQFTPLELLEALNKSVGISLTMSDKNVETGISILISSSHDYGTAYAWFRTAVNIQEYQESISQLHILPRTLRGLPDLSDYDTSLMTRIKGGRLPSCYFSEDRSHILNSHDAKPRRLWDLYVKLRGYKRRNFVREKCRCIRQDYVEIAIV